jgi:quinol monooxygenase YgiN
MTELVESTWAEPGTLTYEWSLGVHDPVAHVYERYADSITALAHLASFRETFAQAFLALVEPRRFIVYGNPSDELKQALEASKPVYMASFTRFAR